MRTEKSDLVHPGPSAVPAADLHRGTRRFTMPAWDLAEEHAAWTRPFEDVRGIVERALP
jgi:hypothetical protein